MKDGIERKNVVQRCGVDMILPMGLVYIFISSSTDI